MGFIAEVRLVHDELPLVPTIQNHPDASLRHEYEAAGDGRRIQFVSAFGDAGARLVEAMRDDPTVSNPTRIAAFGQRTIYRLTVETDLEIIPYRCAEDDLFIFAVTSDGRGWTARIHLPDRDALAAIRRWYRDRGVSFRVTQLYDSAVSDDGTYFLTEEQREILLLAYESGYFDVPRGITQDDLAEQLDVTDSAVSQKLRRAIATLIAATVETDRTADTFV
ncbi:helix-turn-helix domain-containing protein [Halopiger aswanensis]|uniref:Putative DNA binding protein n=1 Tax=Halopiger aswanensis TaxID=148449 RepID=A0A419W105_9EURY|nr:helix-turn-helix domain-containing protein [Halopiger aswanensis]RKD89152.1 putative DNA binding protein [Halopiger aswanensis]